MANNEYYDWCYDNFISMTELQFVNYFDMCNMDNIEYSAYCQAKKDR